MQANLPVPSQSSHNSLQNLLIPPSPPSPDQFAPAAFYPHLLLVNGSDMGDGQGDRLLLPSDDDLVLGQAGRGDANAGPSLLTQLLHQPVMSAGNERVESLLQREPLHRSLILEDEKGHGRVRKQGGEEETGRLGVKGRTKRGTEEVGRVLQRQHCLFRFQSHFIPQYHTVLCTPHQTNWIKSNGLLCQEQNHIS